MDLTAPLLLQVSILAQASAPTGVDSIVAIVAALGGSGFAVWYAYYMTTTQIPHINAEHRQALANLNADHREMMAKVITEFRAEQKESREVFQHSLAIIERDNERNAMAIDRLCNKLGHPGPLAVKADSVVIKKGSDSDPSVDSIRDGR